MNNLYDDYKEEKKEKVLYDTNNISNTNNRKDNLKKMNENKKNLILSITMILVLKGYKSITLFKQRIWLWNENFKGNHWS